MQIRVRDIEETSKELVYEDSTSELNRVLAQGPVHDYEFSGPATVRVRYYRAGQELFFAGEVVSRVVGQCARCLESFPFTLTPPFSLVLAPRVGRWAEQDLDEGEVDLNWYEGEEVDLSPLLRERMLLALPTAPLCNENCRGLCARCGANLNAGSCGCPTGEGDARLGVLRNLKLRQSP